MRKASNFQGGWWWNTLLFIIVGLVLAADQLSKIWIRANLPIGQSSFEAGLFRIFHIQNTGAAFGLFDGQTFLLSIVSVIAIIVILVYTLVLRHPSPGNNMLEEIALGLVLGGTAGNLIDRLHLGYVTDFIDLTLWPTFNVADSAVTTGVLLFAFCLANRFGRH